VTIVGVLESKQKDETNFQVSVNDGTGSISCKQWINDDPTMVGSRLLAHRTHAAGFLWHIHREPGCTTFHKVSLVLGNCSTAGTLSNSQAHTTYEWPRPDSEHCEQAFEKLQEGRYVRVYGSFGGKVDEQPDALGSINAFAIRPVTDHNEARFHPTSALRLSP
jgi:hypothetical protein